MSLQESALTHQKKRFHKACKISSGDHSLRNDQTDSRGPSVFGKRKIEDFVHSCKNRKPPTPPCTDEEYKETITDQMTEVITEGKEVRQIALKLEPGDDFEPGDYFSFELTSYQP